MVKVVVVYHSRTGNTAKMAEAVAEGARSAGVDADIKDVESTRMEDLQSADGIILGSPTYFGTLSSEMKQFIDKSVAIRGKLEDKIGAAFTSSGSFDGGNETTLLSLMQAMFIHGMIVIGDPIESGGHYGAIAVGSPDAESLNTCKKLGARVGNLAKKL